MARNRGSLEQDLLYSYFSQEHSVARGDLLLGLLDQRGGALQESLMEDVMIAPYWTDHPDEFLRIARHPSVNRAAVLTLLESLPHWVEHPQLALQLRESLVRDPVGGR